MTTVEHPSGPAGAADGPGTDDDRPAVAPASTGLDLDHESLAAAALTIARRFSAGATMWCLAPEWPEHARHIAVEFVHPVVMGARALPAVEVPADDPVGALRLLAEPGDLLVAVSNSGSVTTRDAIRRAEPWGLTTVWIGAGTRPPAGSARHVLWVDDPAGTAAHDGTLVLHYHLLWEMTHICFEHPGALAEPASGDDCDDDVCVTCSDEGIVAEVEASAPGGPVTVRTARGRDTIDATLVGDVVPGDLLLVHAGSAISRLEGS